MKLRDSYVLRYSMQMLNRNLQSALVAATLGLAAVSFSSAAAADQLIIKYPGDHPDYVFEAEPHGLIEPFDKKFAFGGGFRGTFVLLDNGFIKTINNSIGLGVGGDIVSTGDVIVPVVMQWNFWLSENWSVFGEPGGALRFGKKTKPIPIIHVGGRFHFADTIALTLRAGYPSFSVGVSFFI